MTLWPGTGLPLISHLRCDTFTVDQTEGTIQWVAVGESAVLPDEWVLRVLLDADLEDDAVVLDLLKGGAILRPFPRPDDVGPAKAKAMMAITRNAYALSGGALGGQSLERQDATLEDCRWWLKAAQALIRICVSTSEDDEPDHGVWEALGFRAGFAEKLPWVPFTDYLNIGLAHFGAHATLQTPYGNYGLPRIDLFDAACRQIFNLIVSDETIRRCASETCGRPFARQINDEDVHRLHYRSDVRYCTDRCARAQAARQYRRRKAARKEAAR